MTLISKDDELYEQLKQLVGKKIVIRRQLKSDETIGQVIAESLKRLLELEQS